MGSAFRKLSGNTSLQGLVTKIRFMSEILYRFSWEAVKFNTEMAVCLGIIWVLVLGTAISSIFSQPFTAKQRLFWLCLIIFLPVVGMLAYLPFSLTENRPTLLFGAGKK